MSASLHDAISFAREPSAEARSEAGTPAYRGALGAIRLYFARKHAAYRLNCLSDRTLADIGVARAEIPGVVRHNLRRG